jgi:hypothetical protein
MSEENNIKEVADLVAHSEHIADDLADLGFNFTDEQIEALVAFTQCYIKAAVERVLESPEWFE